MFSVTWKKSEVKTTLLPDILDFSALPFDYVVWYCSSLYGRESCFPLICVKTMK